MIPADFDDANVTFAEKQPEYQSLPAYRSEDEHGSVTSCWTLSWRELVRVIRTRRIWLTVLTYHAPLQPQLLSTRWEKRK